MADGESQNIAAQEAEIRKLLAAAHEHLAARSGGGALDAYRAASEAALNVLEARIESGGTSELDD